MHQVQSMWQKSGMIVLSVVNLMKHDETNGFSVLQTMRSCEAIVVEFASLESWLSLFSGHLSHGVVASLF